jgi:hypothetical protein
MLYAGAGQGDAPLMNTFRQVCTYRSHQVLDGTIQLGLRHSAAAGIGQRLL